MRLIDNHLDDRSLSDYLARLLPMAGEACIQVAYLRVSGIELLREPLSELARRGGRLRLLTCGDFSQTEPEALRFLRELGGRTEVRMVSSSGLQGFHPKCYLLTSGRYSVLVVGSSNFTGGGLRDNVELNLALELPGEHETIVGARRIFDSLWEATPWLSDECFEDYRRFWEQTHNLAGRLIYRVPDTRAVPEGKEGPIVPDYVDPGELQPGDLVRFNGSEGDVITVTRLGERWSVKVSVRGVGTQTLLSPPTCFERVETPLSRLAQMDFDTAEQFDLLVDATRLSLAYEYDRLVSLSNSRAKLEPYQVAAVHKVVSAWEPRFLIADDVGLGKTVEAGMVIKELMARHRADRVLIVCPAGLTYQWEREMQDKFDERFERLTSADLRKWRSTRPAGEPLSARYPRAIVSVDTAKPRQEGNNAPDFAEAHWDVVVIDEAHKVSQHGCGEELNERYKLARDISPACDALLLLSATPHDGDPHAFLSLLQHLDPLRFDGVEEVTPAALEPIMVRRGKGDIRRDDGSPLFRPRWVDTTEVKFTKEELHLYEEVTKYVREGYQAASAQRDNAVGFLMVLLQKRMVSSVAAIRRSLERRLMALENPNAAALRASELRELRDREDDEEALSDERREELQQRLEEARLRADSPAHKAEVRRVRELVKLARKIAVDTKARELRSFVEGVLKRAPEEKVLVFTEYTDTLDYLRDEVLGKDFGPIAQIYGSMSMEERQQAEEEFAGPGCHLMLATDAAGEGLNLQFCHIMVNYELPWNPNRIEQRIGRLHRYGQDHDVHVYNIQVTNTREGIILTRLLRKVKTIEEQLGGYAPNILGLSASAQADNLNKLSDLIIHAIAQDTPPEVTAGHVEQALEARRQMGAQIESSLFQPLRHFDKGEADRVIRRSAETMPTNADIESFVRRYFRLHQGRVANTRTPRVVRLSTPPRVRYGERVLDTYPRATFDKATAFAQKARDLQFIAFGHPLLTAIIRHCRSRVPGLRGATTAKLLSTEELGAEAGLLCVYTLRFADAHDQTIGETLVPVFVDAAGRVDADAGQRLLRAEGTAVAEPDALERVAKLLPLAEDLERLASAKAADVAQDEFLRLSSEREKQADASVESLEHFRAAKADRLRGAVLQYQQRLLAGDDMDIAIRRAEYELSQLEQDCARRLAQIEARRSVQHHAPELLSVAVLVAE